MDPTDLLAERLRMTFAESVIRQVIGLAPLGRSIRVIGVPRGAQSALAGRQGSLVLTTGSRDEEGRLLADLAEMTREWAALEVLVDIEDPDSFLAVTTEAEFPDAGSLKGAVVADAADLELLLGELESTPLDISAQNLDSIEFDEADQTDRLHLCIAALDLSDAVRAAVLPLTLDTLRVLAGIADGAPTSLLAVSGPASRLSLVETAIVSMADGSTLTPLGHEVADAAAQIVASFDTSTVLWKDGLD